jgi:hypothetical protein
VQRFGKILLTFGLWVSIAALIGAILFFKVTFEMSARKETIGTVIGVNGRKSTLRLEYKAGGKKYSNSEQTGAVLDYLQVGERYVVQYAHRFPILSEVDFRKPCLSVESELEDARTSRVALAGEGKLIIFWYEVKGVTYKRLQWVNSNSVRRFDSLASYPVKYDLTNPASAFVCINDESCWVRSADTTRLHPPHWSIF